MIIAEMMIVMMVELHEAISKSGASANKHKK
jgi:hypothetical protein